MRIFLIVLLFVCEMISMTHNERAFKLAKHFIKINCIDEVEMDELYSDKEKLSMCHIATKVAIDAAQSGDFKLNNIEYIEGLKVLEDILSEEIENNRGQKK